MIQVRLKNKNMQGQIENRVEIIPGNWEPDEWKKILKGLSASKRQTIFEVNQIDDNGLVMVILNYWLKFNNAVLIKTNQEWIKEVFNIAFGENVKFIDIKRKTNIF